MKNLFPTIQLFENVNFDYSVLLTFTNCEDSMLSIIDKETGKQLLKVFFGRGNIVLEYVALNENVKVNVNNGICHIYCFEQLMAIIS